MLLDREALFADNIPVDGTPVVLDLGPAFSGAKGNPITVFVSVSPGVTGMTGLSLQDSADGSNFEALLTITENLAGKTMKFTVPSNARRFLKLNLAGTVANGTWSAGVVLPGVQTAE